MLETRLNFNHMTKNEKQKEFINNNLISIAELKRPTNIRIEPRKLCTTIRAGKICNSEQSRRVAFNAWNT